MAPGLGRGQSLQRGRNGIVHEVFASAVEKRIVGEPVAHAFEPQLREADQLGALRRREAVEVVVEGETNVSWLFINVYFWPPFGCGSPASGAESGGRRGAPRER